MQIKYESNIFVFNLKHGTNHAETRNLFATTVKSNLQQMTEIELHSVNDDITSLLTDPSFAPPTHIIDIWLILARMQLPP